MAAGQCHHLVVPRWHPARLNQWDGRHWAVRAKLKKGDRELVGWYAKVAAIPPAKVKRRVSLILTLGPRQRIFDPDSIWKSCLDALVHVGCLLDDSAKWVELGSVSFQRGKEKQTEIVLEDMQ